MARRSGYEVQVENLRARDNRGQWRTLHVGDEVPHWVDDEAVAEMVRAGHVREFRVL